MSRESLEDNDLYEEKIIPWKAIPLASEINPNVCDMMGKGQIIIAIANLYLNRIGLGRGQKGSAKEFTLYLLRSTVLNPDQIKKIGRITGLGDMDSTAFRRAVAGSLINVNIRPDDYLNINRILTKKQLCEIYKNDLHRSMDPFR